MNRENTGRIPETDLISGLEHDLGNAPPIQEGPVAAIQILDTAGLFCAFEGEMQA